MANENETSKTSMRERWRLFLARTDAHRNTRPDQPQDPRQPALLEAANQWPGYGTMNTQGLNYPRNADAFQPHGSAQGGPPAPPPPLRAGTHGREPKRVSPQGPNHSKSRLPTSGTVGTMTSAMNKEAIDHEQCVICMDDLPVSKLERVRCGH